MWRIIDVPERKDITPSFPLDNEGVLYCIRAGWRDFQARIIGVYTNPLFKLVKRSDDKQAG